MVEGQLSLLPSWHSGARCGRHWPTQNNARSPKYVASVNQLNRTTRIDRSVAGDIGEDDESERSPSLIGKGRLHTQSVGDSIALSR